jgi:starch synthase (maltosyl-transferring)
MKGEEGRGRVIIQEVKPQIDSGGFPIKRVIGEEVIVEGDIFADSYDIISAVVLYRKDNDSKWAEVHMKPLINDRWRGSFRVTEVGRYRYTVMAWIDRFKSLQRDLTKKLEAGQDVSVDLLTVSELITEASKSANPAHALIIKEWVDQLRSNDASVTAKAQLVLAEEITELMSKYSSRLFATTYDRELVVEIDREKARFSTWYELFPRSCASEQGRHGNFKDCETYLAYVAAMGFDVLYLPPIHPIGRTNRKGKNNAITADTDDPGTPWAIGSKQGGHKTIHPQLGTMEDFRRFLKKAEGYGIEVALDLAFQCSPDHPYVKEHPKWFRWRPDKTIQYAENPPKKYQDIYPLYFETEPWQELWEELKSIVMFWIEQGIRIFRVDNPHTKPFQFWEWLISEVKRDYPDVVFLAEAFTRPKVMFQLAKLGFNQSYTYFAWRNTKWEITKYFLEINQTEVHEYFRPNLWANTPDILTEYLQSGGKPAFMSRLVLAATLGANYGIYGPAFELCENQPKETGSEEYLNSEKYEIKFWDINRSNSLKDFIARVNRIRKENSALQGDTSLRFHTVDNEKLICYSKNTEDLSNIILVLVNLDPHYTHSGWVELPLQELGLDSTQPFQVHELLSDARYLWQGSRNYVELNPNVSPAHILRVRRRIRTERDFDYYM